MSEDKIANYIFEENNENEVEYDDDIKMEIILDSDESIFDNFNDKSEIENQEDENMIKEESTQKEDETTTNGNSETYETPENNDMLINNKTKIGEEYNFNKNCEKKENPRIKSQNCGKCFLYFISVFILIIAISSGIKFHKKKNGLMEKENVKENNNKKNQIIIGVDFGSTQSGYQIFYNSEIMLEGNENNKIFFDSNRINI